MPQLVVAVVALGSAGALGATAAAWLATTSFLGISMAATITLGATIYGAVTAREGARRARNQARDAYNAALVDRTVTFSDANAPWQVAYGEAAVGGRIVAVLTSGDRDQYQHVVVVWADHECDAVLETYLAGEPLGTLTGSGEPTSGKWVKTITDAPTDTVTITGGGTATLPRPGANLVALSYTVYSGGIAERDEALGPADWTAAGSTITLAPAVAAAWAGRTVQATFNAPQVQAMVRVHHHLGAPGQAADATLLADCPGQWASTDLLAGKCYSVFRFTLDEPELQGGPPQLKVRLRGKKVYDHRTGTTAWAANAALCVADFLMAEYGKAQPANAVLWATVDAAANVCDEALASQAGAARYTCNGAFTTDADTDRTLDALCQAMAGFATLAGGWVLQAGAWTAPVMDLGVADIVGGIEVVPGPTALDTFNGRRGKFYNPERFDQLTDYTPYQNSAFVAADGGELWGDDMNLPFTAADWRCANLARIAVERQRALRLVVPLKLRAVRLRIGQRVTLTVPWLNLAAAVLRVEAKQFTPGGAVQLTLVQDDPAMYDEADAPAPLAPPTAPALDPFAVAPVASLAATSSEAVAVRDGDGTVLSRVRLAWAPPADTYVLHGGALQVEHRPAAADTWARAPEVPPTETQCDLPGLPAGRLHVVRARWRNALGAVGDWRMVTVLTQAPGAANGYGQNLLPNSDQVGSITWALVYVPAGVVIGAGPVPAQGYATWTTADWVLAGGQTRNVAIHQAGVAPDAGEGSGDAALAAVLHASSIAAAVQPGDRVVFSCHAVANRCRVSAWLGFFDAAGNAIEYHAGEVYVPGAVTLANQLANYRRVASAVAVAPPGAAGARGFVRKFNTFAGQAESWLYLAAPQLERVPPGATGPGPYNPGPPVGALAQLNTVGTTLIDTDAVNSTYAFFNADGVSYINPAYL